VFIACEPSEEWLDNHLPESRAASSAFSSWRTEKRTQTEIPSAAGPTCPRPTPQARPSARTHVSGYVRVFGTQIANVQSDPTSAPIPTNVTGIMKQNSRPEKGRWSGFGIDASRPLQWGRTLPRARWLSGRFNAAGTRLVVPSQIPPCSFCTPSVNHSPSHVRVFCCPSDLSLRLFD
jgi:hypothetical protein